MDIIILLISLFLLIRNKLAEVLFSIILLTTNYLGAGNNLSTFLFTHNVSDAGLILYIALFIYILIKNHWRLKFSNLGRYSVLVYLFLFISIILDLTLNQISFSSVLKTSRHWIFLSAIWIFAYIQPSDIEKLIFYLFKVTLFITIIMIFEFVSGIKILPNRLVTGVSQTGHSFIRGSIPSTFTLFFLFLLFAGYFRFSVSIKYIFIVILVLIVIISMIRSLFIAMIFGIALTFWLKGKSKIRSVLAAISLASLLFIFVLSTPIVGERFLAGFEEVKSFKANNDVEGNFSFRILLTLERVQYIIEKPQYVLFGIGNVTEDQFPEIFRFGLPNEKGGINQLDTGDIAWAILFLRLGFLGTIIYLLIYLRLLKKLFCFVKQNKLVLAMYIYLVINLFLLTFSGAAITQGHFWILPFLVYTLINNKQYNESSIDNNSYTLLQSR